jgi:hypothetical protein
LPSALPRTWQTTSSRDWQYARGCSWYQDDRGGNKYQVQAFGKGTSLHPLWDCRLTKNMNEDSLQMGNDS